MDRDRVLRDFVERLNRAWLDLRFDDLRLCFHNDAILMPPGADEAIVGADAIVASYRQFTSLATIQRFEITRCDLFGRNDVTFCHAFFTIEYTVEGKRSQERGCEIYAIDTSGSAPLVVWRTQLTIE